MASDTKDKILDTAHSLFQDKGFNGVTMREISDKAGINKGLLHYYFKSKQAIFFGVFKIVIKRVFVNISEILERTDIDFDKKTDLIVDAYMEILSKNPKLPLFVLSELGKLPEFSESTQLGKSLGSAAIMIEKHLKQYKEVVPGEGFHYLLSLVSLCAFPFMASPIVKQVNPINSMTNLEFIEARKIYVKNILKKSYR